MPIQQPVTRTIISTTAFGIPVAQFINFWTPTAWTPITAFTNGWGNVSGWQASQYRKWGDNVQVRGYIQSGTANTTAFVLPVGFRPPVTLTLTSNTFISGVRVMQMVQVQSNGSVVPENTGPTDLTFLFSSIQ